MAVRWPNGKPFAFSVIDDTDNATVENVRPFYDALRHYGLRTTKTVWSLPPEIGNRFAGDSLADERYTTWVKALAAEGFEIGWHGARSGATPRAMTLSAHDIFRRTVGEWPQIYANHAQNADCIYWGRDRFDAVAVRVAYGMLRRGPTRFGGSAPSSPYFWGDLCRERIRYVRGFTYAGIVTTEADPFMPFSDASRPYVRAWFSASEAPDAATFEALLSAENVERLAASNGGCVVYTHVASGFVRDGRVEPSVERALQRIATRNGWFVPVGTMLEHLESQRGLHAITKRQHIELERRWLRDRLTQAFATRTRRSRSH